MPKFLVKASYTADGTKGLLKSGGTARKQAVEKMIADLGGKVEAFYFAFGDTDVYSIIDLPDSVTGAAATLTINASGFSTCTATSLFTAAEIDDAAKKTVHYSPPGK